MKILANGEIPAEPALIDWNETLKKEARGIDDYDLGEVQDVGVSYIHTQRGVATKEQFYIPKYLVEGYDGKTLWFKISSAFATELIRESPPEDSDYRTRYRNESSPMYIEERIPVVSHSTAEPPPGDRSA